MVPEDELLLLVKKCNAGSKAAWDEFYRRYHQAVRKLVLTRAYWLPNDVEDVVQEIFLKYMAALKKYDGERPIIPYLLEIARRTTITEYRKRSALKRNDPHQIQVGYSREKNTPDSAPSEPVAYLTPEQEFLVAEQSALVHRTLLELSATCRELLRLKYEDELSYEEIAEQTGLAANGLRVQVHRCLKLLAQKCGIVHKKVECNDSTGGEVSCRT